MKSTIGATITTTLFSPAVAARRFLDEDPFVASLFTFVMAAFSCAVTQLLVFRAAAGFNSSPGFVVWIFIVNLLSGVTILVGGLCFVSFFVLLLGGKVRPGKKIWSLALSFSPWMFSVFPAIVAVAIGGPLGIAVTIPCFSVLFFWGLVILVTMIAEAAETDLLRSCLAVVMSFAGSILLFWIGSFTLFLGGMNLLISLSPPA